MLLLLHNICLTYTNLFTLKIVLVKQCEVAAFFQAELSVVGEPKGCWGQAGFPRLISWDQCKRLSWGIFFKEDSWAAALVFLEICVIDISSFLDSIDCSFSWFQIQRSRQHWCGGQEPAISERCAWPVTGFFEKLWKTDCHVALLVVDRHVQNWCYICWQVEW